MLDPQDHVVAIGPKSGECNICDKPLDKEPSLQLQKKIPLMRKMMSVGRACLPCAEAIGTLIAVRTVQAKKGEYQA